MSGLTSRKSGILNFCCVGVYRISTAVVKLFMKPPRAGMLNPLGAIEVVLTWSTSTFTNYVYTIEVTQHFRWWFLRVWSFVKKGWSPLLYALMAQDSTEINY
jgi:hypothetical protein